MSGFVFVRWRSLAVLSAAALLSACGGGGKDEAAQISVFLNAARTNNRMIFEKRIDRGRVRDNLRDQFAKMPGVQDLQRQLGEGVGDGALDRMISPDKVRRLEAKSGSVGASTDELRGRLRSLGGDRVCLKDAQKADRCLMTFADQNGTWKLVGLYAEPQSFTPPAGPGLVGRLEDVPEN